MYSTEVETLMACKQFTTVLKTVTLLVWEADVFLIYGAALSMVLTPVTSTELGQMTTVKGFALEGGTEMDCSLCNTGINHEKRLLSHQS